MKLKSVEICDYKCIRRSNQFQVGDITCLVGKNESGKTALLEALYRLNPVVAEHGCFDVTDEYPRSDVEDYRQTIETGQADHATVVRAVYSLEKEELKEVEEAFGKGVLKKRQLVLSNGYANELDTELDVDEGVAAKFLVAQAELPTEVTEEASEFRSLQELADFLESKARVQATAYAEAQKEANAISDDSAKKDALAKANALAESPVAKRLRERLPQIIKTGLEDHIWKDFLSRKVPKFLYFNEYYQMTGHENIEQLKQREDSGRLLDSDRPLLGLIELARLNLDDLIAPKRTEVLISKLEGASNHLSKQLLKYWSQNRHLRVAFDVRPAQPQDPDGMKSGTNIWGRVHDSVHEVSTLLGTRSRGFVWFFSFLAWFSQQKKRNEPLILLLDEPGLILHAKAQGDLLRYIEEDLKPHHQVIYTTHSPFMVDPHDFERVRIVEDRSVDAQEKLPLEERGTKVIVEVLEAREASLFPLQGALGYDIAQTLFVGPNSLIVEGVSDLLYLQGMSTILHQKAREGLSNKWTITPVGGSDKVPTFAALLGAQKGLKLATLLDIQTTAKQRIEQLYKRKLLRKKHVLTFADFITGAAEADIEDMFEVDFYLKLLNAEYAQALSKEITESDLGTDRRRIKLPIEDYLKSHPLKKDQQLNHYRPARYFVENLSSLETEISETTLGRFEEAFKSLNALL